MLDFFTLMGFVTVCAIDGYSELDMLNNYLCLCRLTVTPKQLRQEIL